MKISMLYDLVRWEEKAILKRAEEKGMDIKMIDTKGMTTIIGEKIPEEFGDVSLQRSIGHFRGLYSTATLEFQGHRVMNSYKSSDLTGNKLLTSLLLSRNGIPTPMTGVAFDGDSALKLFETGMKGKAVIKPITGSWGRMMGLLKDRDAAAAVIEDRQYMHPLYSIFYLQEFVNKPGRDLRVFVVGDRAIAGIYRYQADGDWRTNTAIGGRAENLPISGEVGEMAVKAANCIGPGIYGVDLMETEKGYTVHEINGTMEFKNTVRVSGVDVPGEMLDYVISEAKR